MEQQPGHNDQQPGASPAVPPAAEPQPPMAQQPSPPYGGPVQPPQQATEERWLPPQETPPPPPPVVSPYGMPPTGWQSVVQPLPADQPLPAYREESGQEDTTIPHMITAASPLSQERLLELEKQTRLPLWPMALTGGILLVCFSLAAISIVMENSIPGSITASIVCIAACAAFLVFLLVAYTRRQQEQRQLVGFAACNQEQDGVIEVYADRVVKITPHTRTVVYFRRKETTVWESTRMLTVSDGYAAIVWQAEDLTVPALEHLRQRIYPAIPPARRKSSGRMIALAEKLPPLPDIALSRNTLCRFQYQPDRRREADRRAGVLTAHTLPFNAAGAAVAGSLLSGLFPLSLPYGLSIALYALLILFLAQGVTTAVIILRQPPQQKRDTAIGIAFTADGLAVEENDCLRFIPRGWYKSLIKKDILALETPVGQLCIPWEAVPDPVLVKRLLTLGE